MITKEQEQFIAAYNKVFDEDGLVRLCSRDNCIELIKNANNVTPGNYGRTDSGYLRVRQIKNLYKNIMKEN